MATSAQWCSSIVWMFVFHILVSLPCETEERVVATEKDRQGREVSGRSLSRTSRTTGGSFAREGSNPWMAALLPKDICGGSWMAALLEKCKLTPGPFCGGSLIHRRYVLTAAHCVFDEDATQIIVRLGAHDWRKAKRPSDYSVEAIIMHEDYSHVTKENDIALLQLTETVELGEHINLIRLPKYDNFKGQTAKFSGWGHAKSFGHSKLRELDVQVIRNADCEEILDEDSDSLTDSDTSNHHYEPDLTVFDTSTCGFADELFYKGDSGGPLSFQDNDRPTLLGVFSWSYNSTRLPGVFVRVTDYLGWLKEEL